MTYKSYNPSEIEPKWQKKWAEQQLYQAEDFSKKEKYYFLVEFPYCSGAGLHIGHARAWLPADALARKKRMGGYNVLFPMGWDAFGLPTENYAIKTGIHPKAITQRNITHFRDQVKALGLSFDWSREIDTSDPKYYKWTQWIFVQLFKKGLAYQAEIPVNWCPFCKTNLADEEVLPNGAHERCGTPVEKRLQKQWLLRITKYADRLIKDLKKVDYPERVAVQQVNWIGKKGGVKIKFGDIEIFTTRPDTIYGATFIVLAPEHPLTLKLVKTNPKLADYIKSVNREVPTTENTGVDTGLTAINPANNKEIPVWISDYVLGNAGTGAIMGVPGHDTRDFEFAQKFNLPVVRVIEGPDHNDGLIDSVNEVFEGEGTLVNSGQYNGLKSDEAFEKIIETLKERGIGDRTTTYHLRDWIFSRQHYWGEPIPIIHCQKCGAVPVPEEQLPVELPYLERYEPSGTGESPLANAKEWVKTACPKCGGPGRRETDTMPNWAGSNWYFVRYIDPHNDQEMADKKLMDYWLPVDVYEGGYEHTTLHLLYSRFIYKFLFDIGAVPTDEPYKSRRVHGILLGSDNRKMSKSFGNVVDPISVAQRYGADTLRLYEMFIGPYDQQVVWNDRSLAGCRRFLEKTWRLVSESAEKKSTDRKIVPELNRLIGKVSHDLEEMKFNTAVAAMMGFVNAWEKSDGLAKEDLGTFLKILAPFAPHLAEELWERLGNKDSVHIQPWPEVEEGSLEDEEKTIVISVNGKPRSTLTFSNRDLEVIGEGELVKEAKSDERVAKHLAGKVVLKTVYIPGRILNFVV